MSRFTASNGFLPQPGWRGATTGLGVAWLALALLIAHAPFLQVVAADLAYTPVEVPLPPVSKPLINDKGQVLTVVTSTIYMYLPTADYGLEAGVHPKGTIAAGGVVMDFNTNGHFVTRTPATAEGSLYKDGAVFTFPTGRVLGLDQLGRVLFSYGSIREVDGSVRTVPGLGQAYFNDINDAGIAVGQAGIAGGHGGSVIWDTKSGGAPQFLPSTGFYNSAKLVNNKNQIFGHRDSGDIIIIPGTTNVIYLSRDRQEYIYLPTPDHGLPAGFTDLPEIRNNATEFGSWNDDTSYDARLTDRGEIYIASSQNTKSIWYRGEIIKPGEHIVGTNTATVTRIFDINNHGAILATGTLNGQPNKLFILSLTTNDPLTVNVTSDADDADPNDGVLDVDLNTPDAQISLRAAINFANSASRPGPDTIEFNIAEGEPTILPTNALPDITEALTIDGSSQPSGRVTLRGAQAGLTDGLRLVTTNCVIRGMVIREFQKAGVAIAGGFGHKIVGNIFGTDVAGGTGFGNGTGLRMENSASNMIGGISVNLRNILSGNTAAGIALSNCTAIEIRANLVGTDPTGAASLPNGQFGLIADKIKNLSIGVASAVSVFNSPTAMKLHEVSGEGSGGGKLVNSYVGLNLGGTVGLAATVNGLIIEDSSDFEIGGDQRNVFATITSNAIAVLNSSNVNVSANFIGTSGSGNVNLPVGTGIFAQGFKKLAIGLTNVLSVINGQNAVILRDDGIGSATGTNASMVNCYIGLNASGSAALGGTETGLRLEGVSGVAIGGAARNVFAGISSNAIAVLNATNINILANHFGTTPNGNTSIPVGIGIAARNACDLVIGMSNQLTVINGQTAVLLDGVTGSGAGGVGSIMNNCFVGLNAMGNSALAAMTNGVRIENSTGFILGGIVRNVFGGITSNAVTVLNSTNIGLLANYIGTSSSGNVNLPVGAGIIVENARDLVIGSTNQLSVINARVGAILKGVTGSGLGGAGSKMNNCFVGLSASGTTALTTTNGVQVENSTGFSFGDIARNVLGGIRSNAITILDSTNIQIAANYIGTSASGNTSLPGGIGILAERARNLTIGSSANLSILNARTAAILRNVLASGGANGMDNCYVGLNANGIASLGAVTTGGIQMENCAEFDFGGVARNILSGISTSAMTVLNSTNIRVLSGYFGTDANGSNRVVNPGNNITVVSSPGFSVGRNLGGAASVLLSGANRHAIEATDSPNLNIAFTSFGTDTLGVKAISNLLSGIKVNCTAGFAANAVAGTTIIKSNLIAFSGNSGIEFTQDPFVTLIAAAHRIEANLIQQNKNHGIQLGTNVSSVTIGGTNLSGANEIIRNGGSGVSMTDSGDRNFVELNAIYANLSKAIETKHQVVLQIVNAMRGSTHVQGNVSGPPNQTLRLHFYGHRPKAGAQGEGELWVGSINVPLDNTGVGSYSSRLPRTTPNGWLVAATAADPILGTSEFSNSQTVQPSTDTDGDGLPDFWEALYPSCLNPAIADPPTEDCDGDGFTNLQEYIAGTDPTQANSALRLADITVNGNGATVTFTGIAGRQYGLDRQSPLGAGVWVRVATGMPEADGQVTLADPNPPPSGNAFYRLVAEFP
ncbi:MAG: hypothetical protein IH623_31695 [Verrucomicrobia bacterium]|nr:hypothetical protein [Verrucomicrobiota bacterium]